MPKNPNIKKVLVLGSGPIVIGQAAEFDYAGTQACRALKEEGIEVVLVNSNPATIMTDKDMKKGKQIEGKRIKVAPLDMTRILPKLNEFFETDELGKGSTIDVNDVIFIDTLNS